MTLIPNPKCQDCYGTGNDVVFGDPCSCLTESAKFAGAITTEDVVRSDPGFPRTGMPATCAECGGDMAVGTPCPTCRPLPTPAPWAPPVAVEHSYSKPNHFGTGAASTEAQEKLMTKLLAERIGSTDPLVIQVQSSIDNGDSYSKRAITKLIDGLMKVTATVAPFRKNLYAGSCTKCGGHVSTGTGRIEKITGQWKTFHLSAADCATAPEAPSVKITETGIYRIGDDLFRVKNNLGKTRLYAQKVVVTDGSVGFHFDSKAIFELRPEHLLTWNEAREFGAAFHSCVNCGKDLGGEFADSDKRAVVAGYGQTCSKNRGWPFPTAKEAAAILDGDLTFEQVAASKGFAI